VPSIADPDPPLPAIVTMDMALAAGLTPDQVRHRVRSRRWIRLARGVYRTRRSDDVSDEWAAARSLHADRSIAEALSHDGCLIGFDSAAVVHGLPLWRSPGPDVSLVARPGGHNGRRPGVVVHRIELHELDVVVDPVPITSVPRTWLDVARSGRLVDGLVLGDAALRAGAMTVADVNRVLATTWARRGIKVAAEAARHLDGVRETALESASWAYFVDRRLPLPRMQVEIRSAGGRFVARVDFLWDEAAVVGEADGRMKYVVADALYAEKRREDEIRAEGFRMVRWGAVDLRGEALAARLRRFLT
jgi:very-short-patch-repair endonuclease